MRHVTLTCRNHPQLRWSCKSIAFHPGYGYNGARNIFFYGYYVGPTRPDGTPDVEEIKRHPGKYSSLDLHDHSIRRTAPEGFAYDDWAVECPCSGRDLVLAPEDPDYGKETVSDDYDDN